MVLTTALIYTSELNYTIKMRVEDLEFRNAARLNNHFFKIKITRQILTLWGGSQPDPQSQSVSTGSDSPK